MKREILINRAIEALTHLSTKVRLRNSVNLTDINIHAEHFFRDLINLIYSYNLSNINIQETNAAAIDLGDEDIGLAIQVTSTSTLEKIRATVKSFTRNNLHETYRRLVILNITEKKKHKISSIGDQKVSTLSLAEDIWDRSDLLKEINSKPEDQIEKIVSFIETGLNLHPSGYSTEVNTFLKLILALSDDSVETDLREFLDEPDPTGKITIRFSDYSEFLLSQYRELYSEYAHPLDLVLSDGDIGTVRFRRLQLYLQKFSDDVLVECNGDAKKALNKITAHFATILQRQGGQYSETAILFFLVDQLIKCNVFPNKREDANEPVLEG